MATSADLFTTCYLTGGSDAEFSKVRVHYRGADEICRTFAGGGHVSRVTKAY
jgi:hypothetical protein